MHERRVPATGQPIPVIGCGTWLGFDVGGSPQALPQREAPSSACCHWPLNAASL